jgi:hypothetical protein
VQIGNNAQVLLYVNNTQNIYTDNTQNIFFVNTDYEQLLQSDGRLHDRVRRQLPARSDRHAAERAGKAKNYPAVLVSELILP